MPTTLYSYAEFKEQQGITDVDDALWVGHRYLLANGAQSDGEHSHYQPPVDRKELLKLLLEFCYSHSMIRLATRTTRCRCLGWTTAFVGNLGLGDAFWSMSGVAF
jgi:hypothetical protein